MDVRIIWKKADGTIRVGIPAPGANPEEFASKVEAHAEAGTTRLPDCDAAALPLRRFRDCWRTDGFGAVQVDMPLARAQRMAEIRTERNIRLDASDKEKARLDDGGTEQQKTDIAVYRQALRDLPAATDLGVITAPEELEAFEPVWPVLP